MPTKKGTWKVTLQDTGPMFMNCIKEVWRLQREYSSKYGLKEAKDLCDLVKDSKPQVIIEGVAKRIAVEAVGKLQQVGAKAEAFSPLTKRESGRKRMKKAHPDKFYFLKMWGCVEFLKMWGCVEPELYGPYATSDVRDKAARGKAKEGTQEHCFAKLSIDGADGKLRVGSFLSGELGDE